MLLLASCGLSLSTAADGNEFSPRGLGGADSTHWFAPASTPSTTRDARLPQSGVLEARLADGYGVGAIRLRVGQEPGNPRVARLDTSWSAAVPGQRDTLRLGDSIDQPGTWGRQVRFAGLHFGTDLGSHLAAAPPKVPEAANAMYVPRAAPTLVQPGLVERTYAAGFLRRNYGLDGDRYGAPFAAATVRLGVSEDVTTELRGNAQQGVGNGGIAFLVRLKGLGLITAAAAASDSAEGTGTLAQTGFEYRRAGFSASVCSAWASSEFRQLRLEDESIPPRHWSVASATYDAARYGVIAIGYAAPAGDDEALRDTIRGTYRLAVGPLSTLTLSVSHTSAPEPDTSLMLVVTFPLDRLARTTGARAAAAASVMRMFDRHPKPTTLAHSFAGAN